MAKKSLSNSPDAKNYEKLANVLRATRESKNVAQEPLALTLGESRTFIQKIEYVERRVDVVEFFRIAKALGVKPTELFETVVKEFEE